MKEIVLEGLDEKIYEYTTKTGLKIYMWVNEKVNSCLMTLSVKYGSIHTKFKVGKKVYEVPNGVAHFLEHIKFNINENSTAHDEFYKIGGDANAFTTFKWTSYIVFATGNKNEKFSKYNIKDYLKQGMPILVQVRKDSTSIKGARISTHLSLPGRFIVLMPSQNFITISQKIDDKNERERLKSIAQKHLPEGYGAIIRTSAEGKTEEEIKVDLNKIIEKYKRVEQEYNNAKQNKNLKPKLIYKSESILERMLTDLIDQGLNRICVDDEKIYTEILNRLKEENKKIEVCAVKNILEMYDIEKQLEQLKNRKIWLYYYR